LTARFGILIGDFRTSVGSRDLFDRTAAAARAADLAGFEWVAVMDHFHQHPPYWDRQDPMPEAYVLLGALAAITKRIRLGTLVTGVTYRNPALLAKMVTTLDVVSEGRAFLGIGASWNEDEFHAYGFGDGLLPIRDRLDRLEESVEICRAMFTNVIASFDGRHHHIDGAINVPVPIHPKGPPILIGGAGERRTLRLVAQHADISNILGDITTL
jgi:F420-dependent oxidoreductase-like protein